MNNNRLSSVESKRVDRALLQMSIDKLLKGPSNIEEKENGRIFIKSLNKILSTNAYPSREGGVSDKLKVELQESNGNTFKTFDSITSCARLYDLSRSTVQRRLQKNEPVVVMIENKPFYVRLVDNSGSVSVNKEELDSPSLQLKMSTKHGNPVNIYEKSSDEGFKLIGGFVSARRAAKFLEMSGSTVIRYMNSGAIYKDRYKFSSK